MPGDASSSTTRTHQRVLKELVGQSRARVAHVRAGQSLLATLSDGTPDGSSRRLSGLHGSAASASKPTPDGGDTAARRAARTGAQGHVLVATSTQQFQDYVDSKLVEAASLHMHDRRGAIVKSTRRMQQLADGADAPPKVTEAAPIRTKLRRAIAVLRGPRAFLQQLPTAAEAIKNPHQAFLEFRRRGVESEMARAIPGVEQDDVVDDEETRPADVRALNATTRRPVQYGDHVCFLSLASSLPLAVDHHGRAAVVGSAATGPHMTFTIVDFRNPSRRDDVLIGDEFWLRVSAAQLELPPDDEILSLLVDSHYYLGCPGWMEDANEGLNCGSASAHHLPRIVIPATTTATARAASKYSQRPDAQPPPPPPAAFKLVVMKATIPATSFYGDDRATREYALENNPHILRLAKWTMGPHQPKEQARLQCPPRRADPSFALDAIAGEVRALVHNCATICIQQGDFGLEYDDLRQRAVLRGSAGSQRAPSVARAWQIRIVRAGGREAFVKAAPPPSPLPLSPFKARTKKQPTAVAESEQAALEWLQRHQDHVATDAKWIRSKLKLAAEARRAYDRVAHESTAMLLEIEGAKTRHPRDYYQVRFLQVLEDAEARPCAVLPRL